MALPISGPFTTEYITLGPATDLGFRPNQGWFKRVGYRQVRPYDMPLDLSTFWAKGYYGSTSQSDYRHYSDMECYRKAASLDWLDPQLASMYNKAYSRLISKVKEETAELGAALGEYRKTADMVNNRAVQIFRGLNAVRRGRFGEANALLRVPPGFRPKVKSGSGAFLEYSFGWAPLVGDLHNSMKILANGVPPVWAKTVVSEELVPYVRSSGTSGNDQYTETCGGTLRVSAGCSVVVSNPNLWLLNQLGLINPVAVAWELVPFSFVIDYFGNIGDVINSWTDTLGLDLIGTYRTYGCELQSFGYQENGVVPAGHPRAGQLNRIGFNGYSFRVERKRGALPGPSLRFGTPKISLRRASTSIALLLQLLKGK